VDARERALTASTMAALPLSPVFESRPRGLLSWVNGTDLLIRARAATFRSLVRRHPTALSVAGSLVVAGASHGHVLAMAMDPAPIAVAAPPPCASHFVQSAARPRQRLAGSHNSNARWTCSTATSPTRRGQQQLSHPLESDSRKPRGPCRCEHGSRLPSGNPCRFPSIAPCPSPAES
jgi:hypothetical protein